MLGADAGAREAHESKEKEIFLHETVALAGKVVIFSTIISGKAQVSVTS
ncbi:MAG: hypothetical protein ACI9K9_001682 [Neolewinella sp.]